MDFVDMDPGRPWLTVGRKGGQPKLGTKAGGAEPYTINRTGNGGLKTTGMTLETNAETDPRTHTGIIQVRFMTTPGKNINVAKAIKEFVAAARQADAEFSIMPMEGEGPAICSAREVPNDKNSMDKYYKHTVKPNNICGTMRVWMKKTINELKSPKYAFRTYLRENGVYINLAQLGEVEGVTVGWVLKGHPAFTDRESIKENIKIIMGEEYESVQYAVFPKNIRYKRESDGARLNTHSIAIQIPKSDDIDANKFRTTLAKKWKESTPITGGSLHGKMFIPLGKDANIQDACMTNVVKQQNDFINDTRQRIVTNLGNIDNIIDLHVETDAGPESTKVTVRNRLSQAKDSTGKRLFTGFEKSQTEGTYRFMFDVKNTKAADEALDDIERVLENMGDWGQTSQQYKLDEESEIKVVGKVVTATADPFWNEYFDFASTGVPSEIDMKSLRHTNKRKKWATASYSDIARGIHKNTAVTADSTPDQTSLSSTANGGTLPSLTVASTADNTTLALLQQKMAQIDQEREKFITEQTRLSDELTSAATSLLKLSSDIVNIRTDMQTLGTDLKGNMLSISNDVKELKEALLLIYKKDGHGTNKATETPTRQAKRKAAKTVEQSNGTDDQDMETINKTQDQDMEETSSGTRRTSTRGFQPKNQY